VDGQVRKVYRGRSDTVTSQRLHASAYRLQGMEVAGSEQAST